MSALRDITAAVAAREFGVCAADMIAGKRLAARGTLARQAAIYILNTELGVSLSDAGLLFGVDRTVGARGCGVIEDWRDGPLFDAMMRQMADEIMAALAAERGEA